MHTITCAIVYWTDRVSFSFVYMCVNQHTACTCAKLLICVVYLEISPAESPPPQITVFFFWELKKKLITAILENSSFLAKTLGGIFYSPHHRHSEWNFLFQRRRQSEINKIALISKHDPHKSPLTITVMSHQICISTMYLQLHVHDIKLLVILWYKATRH